MNAVAITKEAYVSSAVPTVTSPYTAWIDGLDVGPTTKRSYIQAIKDFETWAGLRGITAPTTADVRAYRDELAERINERTGKPFSSGTVSLYIGTVKRFFAWTARHGIYPDVAADVKAPKLSKAHARDYLTTNQVRNVLQSATGETEKDLRDYAIIRLMVTTGLRTIEVSRANVEDLTMKGDSAVLYVQGKGRTDRLEYVEIPAELETVIRRYLAVRDNVQPSQPLFCGVGKRGRTRLCTDTISRIAKRHMQAAGMNDSKHTAHSLRHTAATLNLLNGGTLEETKALLRHASVDTTLIYAHALDVQGNHSASRIEAAIFA